MQRHALAIAVVSLLLAGCQSVSSGTYGYEAEVDKYFEETLPAAEFVARFNTEAQRELERHAERGYTFAQKIVASDQPPLTETEFLTALRVAMHNGYEERGLMQVNGTVRMRSLNPHSLALIERILETRTVPEKLDIDIQSRETYPDLGLWTYIPTLDLPGNDIVIRQVYLSAELPPPGEVFDRGESWFLPHMFRATHARQSQR